MSTKAIREALALLGRVDRYPSVPLDVDTSNPYWGCEACGQSDPYVNISGHHEDCAWQRAATAVKAALAELDALEAEHSGLAAFAAAFAETAEAAVRHHQAKGRGGQHVPYFDDFAGIPPSAVSQLRWWGDRAREALHAAEHHLTPNGRTECV